MVEAKEDGKTNVRVLTEAGMVEVRADNAEAVLLKER
jgi:hypothetical protein